VVQKGVSMHKEKKIEARKLRKNGWAITKIAVELEVSKGSVSLWVEHIPQPECFTKEFLKKKKEKRLKKLQDIKKKPKQRLIYGERIAIRAPEDYTGKKYRGLYVYEHRYILEQKLGRLLKEGEIAHHKNNDPFDNDPENIELKTRQTHGKHHATKGKTLVELTCSFCNKKFKREARNYNTKKRQGQKNFFCCRSHQMRYQNL
jgi:hypothetical protein